MSREEDLRRVAEGKELRKARKKVRDERKTQKKALKRVKKVNKRERKIGELKDRTRLESAKAGLYEAKYRKKKAKRKASPFPRLPDVEIVFGRKKQGKKLSKRRRITL